MNKKEAIQKINAACARIAKQADFAGGAAKAISLVEARLASVRGKLEGLGGNEVYEGIPGFYTEIYECRRILDTIYDGLPMVPAESVATFVAVEDNVKKVDASAMVDECAARLEKAAAAGGAEAAREVAIVKAALVDWEALGETDADGAKVSFLKADKVVELVKSAPPKAPEATVVETTAAPVVEDMATKIAKLDEIAKAAEPVATVAPVSIWSGDLNKK